MPTNQQLLSKGIKYIAGALPCLFIGPPVLYFAFINKLQPLFWLVFGIGAALCLAAMTLLFFGLLTIMKSLFND